MLGCIQQLYLDEVIYDSLASSDNQKLLVRTLVHSHISTAEAARGGSNRPRYVLGSGELGSSPEQVVLGRQRAIELAPSRRAVRAAAVSPQV